MSRKLIKQLRGIKNENGRLNPDRSWVAQNRAKLLQGINCSLRINAAEEESKPSVFDSINEGLHIFVSGRALAMARSSLTIFLVGAVTVSSWIASVSASNDSLPGDKMYGVKMAVEKTELLVASVIGSDEDEVTTILKHASTRVDEYQRSESTEQASEAIKSLKEKIASTQESLNEVSEKSPEEAVAVAKVVEKRTEEILDSLSDKMSAEKSSVIVSESEVDNVQLKKEVVEAEDLIQKTGISAVEVLIEKVENEEVGSEVISKEEVKNTINRKLDKLAEGVSRLDAEVVETSGIASTTIAIIKTASTTKYLVEPMKDGEENPDPNADTSASSTSLISAQIGQTEQKVVEAEQKVVEANRIVEETKVEIKNLIDQNNLTGALDKIKELDGVKSETSVMVVEANKVVAEVQKALTTEVKPTTTILPTPIASTTTNVVLPVLNTSTTVQTTPVIGNTTSSTIKTN